MLEVHSRWIWGSNSDCQNSRYKGPVVGRTECGPFRRTEGWPVCMLKGETWVRGSGCKLPSEKDLEVTEEAQGEQRAQGPEHAVREASGERVAVSTERFVDCPRRGPGDN